MTLSRPERSHTCPCIGGWSRDTWVPRVSSLLTSIIRALDVPHARALASAPASAAVSSRRSPTLEHLGAPKYHTPSQQAAPTTGHSTGHRPPAQATGHPQLLLPHSHLSVRATSPNADGTCPLVLWPLCAARSMYKLTPRGLRWRELTSGASGSGHLRLEHATIR